MIKKLKEVCDFYTGTGFPIKYQGKTEGIFPFYKVGDIANNVMSGNIYLSHCNNYISLDDIKEIKGTIIPEGVVVFAKIGEALKLNRRVITTRKCLIDNNAMGIGAKPEYLDSKFFYYYMKKLKMETYAESTTVPSVRKSRLEELLIDIPSFEKQKLIVNILSKIHNIINNRRIQLLKFEELIKARFVEMFGDVNANDRKWPIKPLGELCNIVRGASPRPIEKFLGGTVPWIKIGDATENESVYLNSTKEHIIENGVKKSRLVKSGSLIFANCGVSLGFARIITFDGCIHDGWLAMEDVDQKLDKVFLLHTLNQVTEHFRKVAPAGTQPNLNTAIMKSYKQILPPLELQRTFIEFAKQVDKSKVAIQKSLAETQLLFDKLMQDYFG